MSYADWNVLMMWTLGWGADRTHETVVLPPPDTIFAALTVPILAFYAWRASSDRDRALAAKAAKPRLRGGDETPPRVILPVFIPMLWRLMWGLAGVAVFGAAACAIVNQHQPQAALLAPFNLFRVLCVEAIHHGVALFFMQPTITDASFRRAAAAALLVAMVYAAGDTVLLGLYFYAEDSVVPKLVMAGVQGVFVAAYALGVLAFNLGRPALRPYAWYTVTWRSLVVAGMLACVFRRTRVAVLPFDFIFMALTITGFPLSLMATLRSDTLYWRGLCRQTPAEADYHAGTALVSFLLGFGDVGSGLGLRGWGARQRAALRRSYSSTPVGMLRYVLACGCCHTSRDAESRAAGPDTTDVSIPVSRAAPAAQRIAKAHSSSKSLTQPLLGSGGRECQGLNAGAIRVYGTASSERTTPSPEKPDATISHVGRTDDGYWRGVRFVCDKRCPGCAGWFCGPVGYRRRGSRAPAKHAVRVACFLCPTFPSWTCVIDVLLLPFTLLCARMTRARRWSFYDDVEIEPRPSGNQHDTSADDLGACCGCRLLRVGLDPPAHGFDKVAAVTPHDDDGPDDDYAYGDGNDEEDGDLSRQVRFQREAHTWAHDGPVLPDDPMGSLMDMLEASRDSLVDFAHVRQDRIIHAGAKAVVFQGAYNERPVAIKVLRAMEFDECAVREFAAEASACAKLRHPNIVRYIGMCFCPPDVSLVFEWCGRGTLRGVLDAMVAQTPDTQRLADLIRRQSVYVAKNAKGSAIQYLPVRYVRRTAYNAYLARRRLLRDNSKSSSSSSPRAASTPAASGAGALQDTRAEDAQMSASIEEMKAAERAGWLKVIVVDDDDGDADSDLYLPPAHGQARPGVLSSGMLFSAALGKLPAASGTASAQTSGSVIAQARAAAPSAPTSTSSLFSHAEEARVGGIRTPSARVARTRAAMALHAALRKDITLLGGLPNNVDECPLDSPALWPVWDVTNFAECWQFDPLTHTSSMHPAEHERQEILEAEEEMLQGGAAVARGGALGSGHSTPAARATQGGAATGGGLSRRPSAADPLTPSMQRRASACSHNHEVDWTSRLRMALQIASAVEYLHGHKPPYLHRDIKSTNILLTQDKQAKLADLGEAKRLTRKTPMTGEKGTRQWMAPEVMSGREYRIPDDFVPHGVDTLSDPLRSHAEHADEEDGEVVESYTEKSDIFSLSVVLWELLAGGAPFSCMRNAELCRAVCVFGARLPIPDVAPTAYAHLIRCGWHPDYRKRPSASVFVQVLRRLYAEAVCNANFDEVPTGDTDATASGSKTHDPLYRAWQGSFHLSSPVAISRSRALDVSVGSDSARQPPAHLSDSLAAHGTSFASRMERGGLQPVSQSSLRRRDAQFYAALAAQRDDRGRPLPAGYDEQSQWSGGQDGDGIMDVVARVAVASTLDSLTVDQEDAGFVPRSPSLRFPVRSDRLPPPSHAAGSTVDAQRAHAQSEDAADAVVDIEL